MIRIEIPRGFHTSGDSAITHGTDSSDLVSVIIPTLNRPCLLLRSIVSALHQTHKALEIIVVDGSPGEETRTLVEVVGDERVIYVRQEPNTGLSAARNIGIRESSGRYVAFLDDDDEWFPEKIGSQLEDLRDKKGRFKASYCLSERYRDETEQVIGHSRPSSIGGSMRDWLCGENVPSPSCVLLERECLDRAGGFREDLSRLEDRELWIRLLRYYDFTCLNKVLVRYHVHQGERISKDSPALLAAYPVVYKTHRDLFCKNPRSHSLFLERFARAVAESGDRHRATMLSMRSIVAYPLRIESYRILVMQLTREESGVQS